MCILGPHDEIARDFLHIIVRQELEACFNDAGVPCSWIERYSANTRQYAFWPLIDFIEGRTNRSK
jgi:hypothetical protein